MVEAAKAAAAPVRPFDEPRAGMIENPRDRHLHGLWGQRGAVRHRAPVRAGRNIEAHKGKGKRYMGLCSRICSRQRA